MFPNWLRKGVWSVTVNTKSSVEWCYSTGRTVAWVVCSTAAILVMPVLFEIERSGVEEQQKQQQRQILLGPGAMTAGPPMISPPPPIPK
jgi:import receptor subunit TOM22